ncbi:MAG: hypothetical protein GY926_05770 [bacterium]|nr:hypothetical protein [bacterium]MCP4964724.1 hypothetical protein [bacterium]
MLALVVGIVIVVIVGINLAVRWSSRHSQDIADYYEDFEDPTAETLLRTNEMRGNHF